MTVTAEDEGGLEQTASATVTVDPGPLTTVAIILDAAEVTAGDTLGFVLEAKDAYGNDRVTDAEDGDAVQSGRID